MSQLDYERRGPQPPWHVSRLVWAGLVVMAAGVAPLAGVMAAAEWGLTTDPNPVGLGLLAFCTFWPGAAVAVAGAFVTARDWSAARKARRGPPPV